MVDLDEASNPSRSSDTVLTPPTEEHITSIIHQHGRALVLYARQWCDYPDDALQDALLDYAKLTTLPIDPVAWLYTAVKRRAINVTRSEKRRTQNLRLAAAEKDPWFESSVDTVDDVQQLQNHLASLTAVEREIVVARVWGELTFEQIGSLIGLSSSSAHRHYVQALGKMRSWLTANHKSTQT